jgi:hypothetical protein
MKFVSEEGQEATKVLPWIPATKTAGPKYDVGLDNAKRLEIARTKLDQMTTQNLSYDQLGYRLSLM